MKNITTLRNHLFDTLERLAQANTIEEINQEVAKAESIVSVAEVLLQSAEVEAKVIHSVKTLHSAFIPDVMQEITLKQIEREQEKVVFNGGYEKKS